MTAWLRARGATLWLWELSLAAWALLLSYFTLGRRGHLDWAMHAIGRDFVNSWTAAHLVRLGHVGDIFYPPLFLDWEHRLFDPRLPFHFWSYPPPNLFLVLPLGWLPYMAGLAAWSVAGLLALGLALRLWTRDPWLWALLLFCPAAAANVGLGQNGAFTAALLVAGLSLIDRRPALSGALLGLLVFKPQIALLLPVVVLAGRRWRTLWAAAAVAAAVLALSALAFGLAAWRGFLGPTLYTQGLMLRQGHGPFMWMMPSAYMSARILGARMWGALAVQAPFTLLAAALTGWTWWKGSARPLELRAAVAMVATFVASPQAFNYDLIPAAVAALTLIRRDPSPALGLGIAFLVWGAPVAMMALEPLHAPLTPLVLAAALIRLAWVAGSAPEPAAAVQPLPGRAPAGPVLA